jgi:hypothetical protein
MEASVSLLDLPPELQIMIMEHLSPQDLCRSVSPACKELHALHANPHLWLRLFKQLLASPRLAIRRSTTEKGPTTEAPSDDAMHDDLPPLSSPCDTSPAAFRLAPSQSRKRKEVNEDEGAPIKQPAFGDVWLLHARSSANQALESGVPIDWKQEFIRRTVRPLPCCFCPAAFLCALGLTRTPRRLLVQSFSVLIVAHHSAHQAYGSRYDLNLYRQLKKVGIPVVDICHPDCCEQEAQQDSSTINQSLAQSSVRLSCACVRACMCVCACVRVLRHTMLMA